MQTLFSIYWKSVVLCLRVKVDNGDVRWGTSVGSMLHTPPVFREKVMILTVQLAVIVWISIRKCVKPVCVYLQFMYNYNPMHFDMYTNVFLTISNILISELKSYSVRNFVLHCILLTKNCARIIYLECCHQKTKKTTDESGICQNDNEDKIYLSCIQLALDILDNSRYI